MTRVTGEAALVLHVRPYRETSAIVNLLTLHHGRVAVVARGARGKRGNPLQPFSRIRASWQGHGTLATLVGAESDGHLWLTGSSLTAGLYVLELLNRLVPERESAPRIFAAACWVLEALRDGIPVIEVALRQFEQLLLTELGYGIDFRHDALSGQAIEPDASYWFDPQQGFRRAPDSDAHTYAGHLLLEIARGEYESTAVRAAAKRISRRALAVLLGPRPLASRKLVFRLPA